MWLSPLAGIRLRGPRSRTVCAFGAALVSTAAFAATDAQAARNTRSDLAGNLNQVRIARGLPPLAMDPNLSRAAQSHSADMVRRDYFLHTTGPGGASFWRRILNFWHPNGSGILGEVMAWGTQDEATNASAVARWLASPPHRRIILSTVYTEMGIGIAAGSFLGNPQATVWTVDLAAP
jgi:uncharacterized protein YkwD